MMDHQEWWSIVRDGSPGPWIRVDFASPYIADFAENQRLADDPTITSIVRTTTLPDHERAVIS